MHTRMKILQCILQPVVNIAIFCYQITANEAANIAHCFKSKDFSYFQSNGVYAEGKRYTFLRELDEGKVVLAKDKGYGAVTIQASKTAVIIAHTAEGAQQGNTNKGVAVIAEYLESMNM